MGFSRQEYWSRLPFPPPGDLPFPGIKPTFLKSPALAGRFFTTITTWEAPHEAPHWSINTRACLPSREERPFSLCVNYRTVFWVKCLKWWSNFGRLGTHLVMSDEDDVCLVCLDSPSLCLLYCWHYLFILPCFTLESILVWMVNFMVMLFKEQKTPAFFSDGLEFCILRSNRLKYKHVLLDSLFLSDHRAWIWSKFGPFPP